MAKIKGKERILKATREKQQVTYKGIPIRPWSWLYSRNFVGRERHNIFTVMKKEKPTTKNAVPSKALTQIWLRDRKFYRQAKAERAQHHQTSFTRIVKGTSLSKNEKAATRNMKIAKG